MKKIVIAVVVFLAGATGYYFTYGQQAVIKQLKKNISRELQILKKNGFEVEDRKVDERSEYFVLKYADPVKISNYLQSKKIDITVEESEEFRGVKLATDIKYLDGVYSAVSADIYPVAFSDSLMSEAVEDDRKILEKIISDQIFLLHVEVDKLFSSFRGYIKDIDTVIESDDPLTIVSKGFKFSGEFDEYMLQSSTNSIESLKFQTKSGANLIIENLDGVYKQEDKDLYDYGSQYTIKKVAFHDEQKMGSTLQDIKLNSSVQTRDDLMKTHLDIAIGSSEIKEPRGEYLFEGSSAKVSIENISKSAIEKMSGLDANDSKEFDEVLQELLSQDPALNIEEIAIKKIEDSTSKEMVDGFSLTASIKQEKKIDPKELHSDPLLLLDTIGVEAHIEFPNHLYILLKKKTRTYIDLINVQTDYQKRQSYI